MAQTKQEQQKQAYSATLQRLERIRNHLDKRPRSGRLSGKVAIITGCGSLAGIGSVQSPSSPINVYPFLVAHRALVY